MQTVIVRTFFTNGEELQGSPGRQVGHWESVNHLRAEMRARWHRSFNFRDIKGGIELTPKTHHGCGHGKQLILLEGECDDS